MLKIAHRGASGYAPENSLAAFEKAVELEADMIELDLRVCKSGEPVIIHDSNLLRNFSVPGWVKRKTLAELKTLTTRGENKLPTLKETLENIQGRAALDIELKERGTAAPALNLITDSISRSWPWNKFLLSSFHHQELVAARRCSDQVRLGILYAAWPLGYQNFVKKIRATAIIVNRLFLKEDLIKQAQNFGLQVYVWTVNSPREIARFKKWGVDGILSDYPDRL